MCDYFSLSASRSEVKLKLEISGFNLEQCATIYSRSATLNPKQMCAGGEEGRDSCSGDSGRVEHAFQVSNLFSITFACQFVHYFRRSIDGRG